MNTSIFDKAEITRLLVEITKVVHPWYKEIRPDVTVYDKDKYINLDCDKVRIAVNYDVFGYIKYQNGRFIARGSRLGVGYVKEVPSVEDGIRYLVEEYFA